MRIEDIDREFRELSRSLEEAQQAFRSGNFAQAEPLYRRALELSERSYGDDHPDTCTCLQNLADTYYSLRRYKESVPLLRRLLIALEKQHGVAHAEVAGVLFKLAKSYEKMGQPTESDTIYRRAVKVGEQVYGKESTFVATVLESFAGMLRRAQIRLGEAEQIEEYVRDIREKLGNYNRVTSSLLGQLSSSIPPGTEQAYELKSNLDKAVSEHEASRLRSLRSKTTGDPPLSTGINEGASSPSARLAQANVVVAFSIVTGIVLALGGGLSFYFSHGGGSASNGDSTTSAWTVLNSLFSKNKGSTDNVVPGAQKRPLSLMFSSPDGLKHLTLVDQQIALYTVRGVDLKGLYKNDAGTIVFTPDQQSLTYTFHKVNAGLIDQDESVLYADDAPEMMIVSKMKLLAATANRYFRTTGHYPPDVEVLLHAEPRLTYKNPFTDRTCAPIKRSLLGFDEQSMSMNLNDLDNMQNVVRQLSIYTPDRFVPGAIECYRNPTGPEGDSFLIRGCDRTGRLFHGSRLGLVYMIVCADGRAREQ